MRSRSLALATAAAVTVSGILVPAASAEQREVTNEYIADNFHSPFTLPEKTPEGVILQVGGNENEAMLNWVTQKGITGQSVQFAPEGTDVAKGEVVAATSKDSVVSLTEGKLKDPEVEPVFNSKYYQFFDFKTGERDEDTKENFDQTVKEKTIRDYTALWNQQEVPNYTNVEVTPEGLKVSTFAYNTGDRVDEFTLTRAADDAGQADQGKGDQDPQEGGSSDNTLAIALGVLAGLLAILGGGAWAAQQGLIPGVNLDNLLP
ncbi:hypothetical protein CGOTT_03305 [Corynebacterium gottingense]|uniref:Peptidase n=2 Tax=Corynebacterium gottingense TaxID=2041036 RepID=A0ABX9UI64_9CORY|nr:hypothetical protein EAW56_08715 [Corynebacterium gottingense]WJZ12611.1 hypothetical protein CGOTT_03305 [Corynebacterium gottingense]WJZ14936.1 hypothetical protein CGOTTB_03325 [Corynebacterium gottingense]